MGDLRAVGGGVEVGSLRDSRWSRDCIRSAGVARSRRSVSGLYHSGLTFDVIW